MFTLAAIICTIFAIIMIPHGGQVYTRISKLGCYFGIAAVILWCVVFIAVGVQLIGWLWVHAP